jgi:hypothetical protein
MKAKKATVFVFSSSLFSLARHKHTSLNVWSIGDKEKEIFSPTMTMIQQLNKLEGLTFRQAFLALQGKKALAYMSGASVTKKKNIFSNNDNDTAAK